MKKYYNNPFKDKHSHLPYGTINGPTGQSLHIYPPIIQVLSILWSSLQEIQSSNIFKIFLIFLNYQQLIFVLYSSNFIHSDKCYLHWMKKLYEHKTYITHFLKENCSIMCLISKNTRSACNIQYQNRKSLHPSFKNIHWNFIEKNCILHLISWFIVLLMLYAQTILIGSKQIQFGTRLSKYSEFKFMIYLWS